MSKMDRATIGYIVGHPPSRFPHSLARLQEEAKIVDRLREAIDAYAARVITALAREYRKRPEAARPSDGQAQ